VIMIISYFDTENLMMIIIPFLSSLGCYCCTTNILTEDCLLADTTIVVHPREEKPNGYVVGSNRWPIWRDGSSHKGDELVNL